MSKIKCIPCDGLGYYYNQVTFQSEHCPPCEGKGVIEIVNETPTPVVEAPKAPKKAKLDEAPIVETPTTFYGTGSIETTTSGSL